MTTPTPLATNADVAQLLGRTLTSSEQATVDAMLAKASADFRKEAGRRAFTAGSRTERRKVNGGVVYTSQRPIDTVTSLVDAHGSAVPYTARGSYLEVDLSSGARVWVDYSWAAASDDVLELVKWTVAEAVKKAFSIDPVAATGVTQHSHGEGPYSESKTFASWAVGGQTLLSPEDKATAHGLRFATPTVWVQDPR